MIEQRTFRIHELADLDLVADELDQAFAEGWYYVGHFAVGRGSVLVLSRVKPEQNGDDPKKQLTKAGAR